MGDLAVGPVSPGQRPDRKPDVARTGLLECVRQQPGKHQRVVKSIVGAGLWDVPMPGKGFQSQVIQAKIEPAGELHRAHDVVNGQCDSRTFSLGDQKRIIERGVVGNHGAAVHQLGEVTRNVAERRLVLQHL